MLPNPVENDDGGFEVAFGVFFASPGRVKRVEGAALRRMFFPSPSPEAVEHLENPDFIRGQLKHYGVLCDEWTLQHDGVGYFRRVIAAGLCNTVPPRIERIRQQLLAAWFDRVPYDEMARIFPSKFVEKYIADASGNPLRHRRWVLSLDLTAFSTARVDRLLQAILKVHGLFYARGTRQDKPTLHVGWNRDRVTHFAGRHCQVGGGRFRVTLEARTPGIKPDPEEQEWRQRQALQQQQAIQQQEALQQQQQQQEIQKKKARQRAQKVLENNRRRRQPEVEARVARHYDFLLQQAANPEAASSERTPIGHYIILSHPFDGKELTIGIVESDTPGIFTADFDFCDIKGIMVLGSTEDAVNDYCEAMDEPPLPAKKSHRHDPYYKYTTPRMRRREDESSPQPHPLPLEFTISWRGYETGEGMILSSPESGSLTFDNDDFNSFTLRFDGADFLAKDDELRGLKISDGQPPYCYLWSDFSEAAYERAAKGRWRRDWETMGGPPSPHARY